MQRGRRGVADPEDRLTDGINIDLPGETVDELSARIVRDENGKPRLEPVPGTAARWYVVLDRHFEKGQLRVAISRVSERRSLAQNRLLWHVYGQILDALREKAMQVGEVCPWKTTRAVHEAMKHRFIGQTVDTVLGEDFPREPTSTVLTVEQFSAYLRRIVEMWALKGVYVEMPGESA